MSIVEPIALGPLFELREAEVAPELAPKYHSTRDFANFSIGLCWLTVLINAGVAVWDCVSPFTVVPALRGIVPPLAEWIAPILYDSAWFLAFALPLVLTILVYRFSQNLHALGVLEVSVSPAKAALSFFVPFLNLLLPGKVVAEFCEFSKVPASKLLSLWQMSWIIVLFTIGAYACFAELIFYVPGVNRPSALVVSAIAWIPIQMGFAFFLGTTAVLIKRLQQSQEKLVAAITK